MVLSVLSNCVCTKDGFYEHRSRDVQQDVKYVIKKMILPPVTFSPEARIFCKFRSQTSKISLRFEVVTVVTEECHLLGYQNPVRTSQQTHYVSATEPSRLMLCKIWGLHGSDYEECRLLEYKNLVRTAQEKHCVSAIEPNRLMLCTMGWLWRMPYSAI
jgi:hypothetical protein